MFDIPVSKCCLEYLLFFPPSQVPIYHLMWILKLFLTHVIHTMTAWISTCTVFTLNCYVMWVILFGKCTEGPELHQGTHRLPSHLKRVPMCNIHGRTHIRCWLLKQRWLTNFCEALTSHLSKTCKVPAFFFKYTAG